MTEVSKKAGEMWAKIDSDTKDRFEKKAKAAKEKYEEDYKVNLKTMIYLYLFSASFSLLSDQRIICILQEWLEGGGAEALKAAKKEKKASGSSPKKSPKKKSGASSSAMSGKGFKSAEYIKDSGSSSNDDDDDKGGNKSGSGSDSGGKSD